MLRTSQHLRTGAAREDSNLSSAKVWEMVTQDRPWAQHLDPIGKLHCSYPFDGTPAA